MILETLGEAAKRLWPFIILMLFTNKKGKFDTYDLIAIIVLSLTIFGALVRYFFFRFFIEDDKLIIKSGWAHKETDVIPLPRIQAVEISQGPVHQLFGIVKLSIDTAGSTKTEVKIDALHKPMAEALRTLLLSRKSEAAPDTDAPTAVKPQGELLMRLDSTDLLKLSISANHIEAFFIMLTFIFGLYEGIKDIVSPVLEDMDRDMPAFSSLPYLVLAVAVLFITILVSTARIVFRFYRFSIVSEQKGMHIRSGLTHVKERLIPPNKIQYISWKASWLRRFFGLWLLEYHIAGSEELGEKKRVQVPVTKPHLLGQLATPYYDIPKTEGATAVHMHPAFITRRVVNFGLVPAVVLVAATYAFWDAYSLLFLLLPLFVFWITSKAQRRFRLYALEDALFLNKGVFGEAFILMQWHKLQGVKLTQSPVQRRKGLASLHLNTASDSVLVHFISLEAAQEILNFAMYKIESSERSWN